VEVLGGSTSVRPRRGRGRVKKGRETKLDTKLKAKEIYIESIGECIVNLSKEAVEDGLGEYYDDAVEDLLTNVPTSDLAENGPSEAYLGLLRSYWETIEALKDVDLNGIELPEGEELSFLAILIFLNKINPSRIAKVGSPEYKLISRIKTILKKRMAIDVIDESELLRGRERIYHQHDDLYRKVEVE